MPIIVLFGINQFKFAELGFGEFMSNSWAFETLSTWLKPAVLFNLLPFLLFINTNRLKSAQGIVFGTIIYGLFIVYLMFFY
ncbi:hypothetical protein GYB22_06915 [bacterium]|nr:hypothetical protein [bacterium]